MKKLIKITSAIATIATVAYATKKLFDMYTNSQWKRIESIDK